MLAEGLNVLAQTIFKDKTYSLCVVKDSSWSMLTINICEGDPQSAIPIIVATYHSAFAYSDGRTTQEYWNNIKIDLNRQLKDYFGGETDVMSESFLEQLEKIIREATFVATETNLQIS